MLQATKLKNMRGIRSATDHRYHALVFAVFAFGGIIGTIAVKFLGFGLVVAISGPAAFIVAYVIVSIYLRRFSLRFDQVGDNCYYLGFLYTLTSLSFALWSFSSAEPDSQSIISSFGIALSSTIFGVVFRVLLGQMRADPVEVEEQSRLELSEAAAQLRSTLDGVALEMNSFRRSMIQSVSESAEELSEKLGEELSQITKRTADAIDENLTNIKKSNANLDGRLAKFQELAARNLEVYEGVVRNFENLEAPAEVIAKSIEPSFLKIRTLLNDLADQQRESQAGFAAAAGMISESAEAAQKLKNGISSVASGVDSIGQFTGNLETINKSLDAVRQSLETTEVSIRKFAANQQGIAKNFSENAEKTLEEIATYNRKLIEEVGSSAETTVRVHNSFAQMAKALADRLG